MKRIGGTFDGTAATINIGIGFRPDEVRVYNMGDAGNVLPYLVWMKNFRKATNVEGFLLTPNAALADYATGEGLSVYTGGVRITTSNETNLIKDPAPSKIGSVNKWTLDTSGNRTGHFNIEKNSLCVVESRILIAGDSPGSVDKWYTIEAITSDGEAADEVTLSEAAPTGIVKAIIGAFDYIAAAVDIIMPEGFTIKATGALNVDAETMCFTADLWDLM